MLYKILTIALAAMSSMAPTTMGRSLSQEERITINDGVCLTDGEIVDATTLENLRGSNVEFFKKRGIFRNGVVSQIKTLNRPGKINAQGCADLCLMDWRTDASGDPVDTDCATDTVCPMNTGTFTPLRECQAFAFNRRNKKCILYTGDTSLEIRGSSRHYSGFLECDEIDTVDQWAAGIN